MGTSPAETEATVDQAETAYAEALVRVKSAASAASCAAASFAADSNAVHAELQLAQTELKRTKSQLSKLRKRRKLTPGSQARRCHPAWAFYPLPQEIPRDIDDPRWAHSFAVEERKEAQRFWEHWGFVVFRDVLTSDACRATEAEIWATLEQRIPGLSRDLPETYQLLPSKRYGLPDEQAIFTPQIVRNRQSPRLYAALDAVTPQLPHTAAATGGAADNDNDDVSNFNADGSLPTEPGPHSIVVSQDRWCLYPPSLGQPDRQTGNPGAHLDICPWAYLPRAGRRQDPESDIEALRYDGHGRVRQICDFRAKLTRWTC